MSGILFTTPRWTPVNNDGEPRAAARLYFYQAGTALACSVYTTSALSVAHSHPVVANAFGTFPAIYLDPAAGYDYKVVLTDSAGVQLWSEDTISVSLSQTEIGEALYPVSAAETAAGVTPVNYSYPPGNVLRYGTNTTPGTTDMTTALQTAINVASWGQQVVDIPAGHYLYSRLLVHYHAADNPGFNTTATSNRGRILLRGAGCGDQQNFANDIPVGSVLETSATTGNGFSVGDGAQDNVRNVVIEDLAFWAKTGTSGNVVHWNYVSGWSRMDRCFVGNAGTGNGLVLNDVWNGGISDIESYGPGTTTGKGVWWQNLNYAGGIVQMNNVTGRNFKYGVLIGGLSVATGNANRCSTFTGLQGLDCDEGIVAGYGCQDNVFLSCWTENNATCGFRAAYSCINNQFVSCYSYEPSATEGSFVLGLKDGTTTTTAHKRTDVVNYTADSINVAGIVRWVGSEDLNCSIDTPRLIGKTASVSAITKANPGAVTTSAAHGYSTGDKVKFASVGGMTEVNGNVYTITVTGATTFMLGVDTTGFTVYTSGGTTTRAVGLQIDQQTGYPVAAAQHGLTLTRPTFTTCAYEVVDSGKTDRSSLVDLYVAEDTLGRHTFNAPVTLAGTHVITHLTGAAAPSANAAFVGQIYVDTTADDAYMAIQTGTGGTDWKKITP